MAENNGSGRYPPAGLHIFGIRSASLRLDFDVGFAKHSRTSCGVRGVEKIELQLIFEHMLVIVYPISVARHTLVREGGINR